MLIVYCSLYILSYTPFGTLPISFRLLKSLGRTEQKEKLNKNNEYVNFGYFPFLLYTLQVAFPPIV